MSSKTQGEIMYAFMQCRVANDRIYAFM